MRRLGLGVVLLLAAASAVSAQEWRVGAQMGRVTYPGALTGSNGSTIVVGLSRISVTDWLGFSAGIPLQSEPYWGAAGAWRRWRTPGASGIGADLSAHAFFQHDPQATTSSSPFPFDPPTTGTTTDLSAQGAGGEAGVHAFAELAGAEVQLRGGATAGTTHTNAGSSTRFLPLADASVRVPVGLASLGAEARRWWGDSIGHTHAGATAQVLSGPLVLSGSAGRWLRGGTGGNTWGVGASLLLGRSVQLEGSFHGNAFDPLYAAQTGNSFSVGASVRVGGSLAGAAPIPAKYENGRATVRLRAEDAKGQPRVAGDFNDWKPQPMTRAGDSWTFTVALKPGVYHYAFVNERGEWFVPRNTPGRQSDGMGGWQAVLVVQ